VAQKTPQQQRFIGERTRALAIVYLTRRPDVQVRETVDESGFDLLVTVHSEKKHGLRQFAVSLKGARTRVAAEHANSALRPSLRNLLRDGPFPFPVVLFYFTMENSEGWYTWVAEPVVSEDGGFELRSQEEAACQPLDDQAVDEIIDRVDRWYDAFFARTQVVAPRRRQ
jgi:hypothetical protein